VTGCFSPDNELEQGGVKICAVFLETEGFLSQLAQGMQVDKCMQRRTLSALTQVNRETEIPLKSHNVMD